VGDATQYTTDPERILRQRCALGDMIERLKDLSRTLRQGQGLPSLIASVTSCIFLSRLLCDIKGRQSIRGMLSNLLRRATVGAAAVQVDEDVAGLGAIAGADDAAVLQLVHDAGGPPVAQAQAPLEQ
jgi:hypothetical protein